MQPKVIISHLTRRLSRNIYFWLLFTFWMYAGKGNFITYYPALLLVLLVSYGIPAYINNLWLIPKFLLRHKYPAYLLWFLLLLALTTIASFYETHGINNAVKGLDYMGNVKNAAMVYHAFPSLLMFSLLAFGKFITDVIQNQYKLEDMEKQKLTSELDTLRSQVNPHFLFNALNTIYGLVRRTDADTADIIIKLSDILRHSLYECENNEISLEKEVNFISQYVDFAQLRLHDKKSIALTLNNVKGNHKIAPLLLIPFIENAIKHGLEKNVGDAWVSVSISVEDSMLSFSCTNSISHTPTVADELPSYSGIGLPNVKRRLELLYPNGHELLIGNEYARFSVNLKIMLK